MRSQPSGFLQPGWAAAQQQTVLPLAILHSALNLSTSCMMRSNENREGLGPPRCRWFILRLQDITPYALMQLAEPCAALDDLAASWSVLIIRRPQLVEVGVTDV